MCAAHVRVWRNGTANSRPSMPVTSRATGCLIHAKPKPRLRMVDEHIAHEVAHRLDPLVATFGDDPEWHNKAAGETASRWWP